MQCELCHKQHDGSYGSGRFCSSFCARGFSAKADPSRPEKIQRALKGKPTGRRFGGWTAEHRAKAASSRRSSAESRWKNTPWEKVPKRRRRERILLEQEGKCAICFTPPTWCNKPLTFQLDHVSGDREDESRSNLRLLCPNCHSQTDTWCSKNVTPEGKRRMVEALTRSRKKVVDKAKAV